MSEKYGRDDKSAKTVKPKSGTLTKRFGNDLEKIKRQWLADFLSCYLSLYPLSVHG